MKRRPVLVASLCLLAMAAGAQTPAQSQSPDLFDFWIGDWDVSWTNADGSRGQGRNRIAKVLDGSVIEENFEAAPDATSPAFKGRSLSVLHKATGVWRQAWTDNQGGYFSFTAQVDGDRRIFITDMAKATAQRMVFHAIRSDSLTWDWERTDDGGKSWKLLWRIQYKRRS
ncbi:hypothetical protein [Piscinibacter sp. XHJ-5]|uniref:hypothetical protein n=1 Tax=Piscinibacter sp. XHJ-5 TaxID=3037797 RepID=UPI002452C15F|nr:hypothetical protein [Piscinibacter sp. XHJ-5]